MYKQHQVGMFQLYICNVYIYYTAINRDYWYNRTPIQFAYTNPIIVPSRSQRTDPMVKISWYSLKFVNGRLKTPILGEWKKFIFKNPIPTPKCLLKRKFEVFRNHRHFFAFWVRLRKVSKLWNIERISVNRIIDYMYREKKTNE